MAKHRKTTYKERLEIVHYCLKNDRKYTYAAEAYNVSYTQVYQWVKKYDTHGEEGLLDRRGKRKAEIRKKRKGYIKSTPQTVAENILNRNFKTEAPNTKWLTDVTEFKIKGSTQKLYLSAILDLYDRSIIAYEVRKRNDNNLVFNTFKKAIKSNLEANRFSTATGAFNTQVVFSKTN